MVSLAFYKAEKGTFIDKLIGWWTRPSFFKFWDLGYSHVEILFFDNMCFASSPRDNGTRWKVITDIRSSGKWDIIEVSKDPIYTNDLISSLKKWENKKYDWVNIFFTQFLPFDIEDSSKVICSELVAAEVYKLKNSYKFSPNKLFTYIKRNYLYK